MAKEEKKGNCCAPGNMPAGCCKVEALVSIDERGQMVLPKEARDKANIHPGDKLAVISWGKGEEVRGYAEGYFKDSGKRCTDNR